MQPNGDVFKFFREKGFYHKVEIVYNRDLTEPTFMYFIDLGFNWRDYKGANVRAYCVDSGCDYLSYGEAESACLDRMIEISVTRSCY